jgi:hypothetical protein
MRPVRRGEPDIGDAQLKEAASVRAGGPQRLRQQLEALGRQRREQTLLVAEVVGRRGVRHPGPAGKVTQAQRRRTALDDGFRRRGEQRAAQIPMVVALLGHALSISCH